ncbi:hypothetical protein BDFB_009708 [Asbolus verrucosus]|uniref:Uncharacterized protein n=1 Tax=Asbolus verrucosus TaxID=1661398 RepID=A0A482VD67_ASBVE|nr:hypothetical protein BDFB_009708 [Asbolus verrucosus]
MKVEESQEMVETVSAAIENLLPVKSRKLYYAAYKNFKMWYIHGEKCADHHEERFARIYRRKGQNFAPILGVANTYRTEELTNLSIDDIQNVGFFLIINIFNTKNKLSRTLAYIVNMQHFVLLSLIIVDFLCIIKLGNIQYR